MDTMRRRRPLVAVVTALACLLALSTPAAAVPTTYTATVTAGTISFTKTGVTENVPLWGSCDGYNTIDLHFTSNTVSSNVTAAAINLRHVHTFSTTATYLLVFALSNVGAQAGHLTTHPFDPWSITSLRVPITITAYPLNPFLPCSASESPSCRLAAILHLSGSSTGVSSSSYTFALNGSSVGTVVANPTCGAGPTQLVGTTSTMGFPLTGHLV